eukprot:1433394-Rhodomonas_salina.2
MWGTAVYLPTELVRVCGTERAYGRRGASVPSSLAMCGTERRMAYGRRGLRRRCLSSACATLLAAAAL